MGANHADVKQMLKKIKKSLESAQGENVARRDELFQRRGFGARVLRR